MKPKAKGPVANTAGGEVGQSPFMESGQESNLGLISKELNGESSKQMDKGPFNESKNRIIEYPFNLGNIQEAISLAMKEAMAIQLKDWFQAGKDPGKLNNSLEASKNKDDSMVQNTTFEESGSRESHYPSKKQVKESSKEIVEGNKEVEAGSFTRVAVEACEQLSRERGKQANSESKQEAEVNSPVTTRAKRAKQVAETSRASTRQIQKRGGKPCTRGEVVALAAKRKEEYMSPGTHFTILDFLSNDALLYIAKSCGVSLGENWEDINSTISVVRDNSRVGSSTDR